MPNDVQIKQFDLAEQDSLLAFLRIAYPKEPRKHDEAFWKWHYLENPYTSLDDIPLWIAKSGAEIVGQLATIPVELKVGKETRRAIWILDFIVRADFRGRGLGNRLVLAARESYPTMMALGINEQSTAVFRKLSWVPLGAIHRYQRLLYAGDALKEISRLAPLRALGNLAYAPARSRLRRATTNAIGDLRAVSAFDGAFDDLWQRAATQWPCAVVRSSRYLDWQFVRQPGKQFEVLGLYDEQKLLGYVTMYFRKAGRSGRSSKVAINDICYDKNHADQIVDRLLKAAIDLALERSSGSLVADVLDPRIESKLQQSGFWRIKNAPQFMAYAPQATDAISNASNWFLTRGDSDVSIFEEPNLG